ncbi:uncharacterized protein LOC129597001 [Paramacrobiotus metropolitanus]|uniref:uncharacterized protein LOC129597001 n=1 Tax=Paramacrobiotus metropolitanus TaxID=2943436 RepID=UPI002445FCA3|nr:uncharacterized protein LOC129597001 [Paramacrobiotus metropolitanus]
MSLIKVSLLLALAVVYVAARKGDDEANQIATKAFFALSPDGKPPPQSRCGGKYGRAQVVVTQYVKSVTPAGTEYNMFVDLNAPKSGSSPAESMKNKIFNVLKKKDGSLVVKKEPCIN